MPKSLQSLDDHTQDTLDARRRSQSSRFKSVPPGVERVAEVLETSLSSVAEAFKSVGFRWSSNSLRLTRKVDVFTHIIFFKGDAENCSGSHVGVSIYAQAKSAKLGKWRESHGVANDDTLWISQIGYLPPTHEYLKWQLVEPNLRPAEVNSMIDTIRQRALPAFEVCSSMERLAERVLDRPEITYVPDWAVDVALWAGNKCAAEALVRTQLAAREDLIKPFYKLLEFEAANPSDVKPADRLHRLAWVVHKHGLQPPLDDRNDR